MPTLRDLQAHLGRLSTILWNYGASFPVPTLDRYSDTGNVGFAFDAELGGSDSPRPALIRLSEIWEPAELDVFRRRAYAYDFIDHPRNRRRAFHGHHPDYFAHRFDVIVHEHCEEVLGEAACSHYYGLPVDGYEAIRRFASLWGQPGPLGCSNLLCMS